jgi:hypothetical protein
MKIATIASKIHLAKSNAKYDLLTIKGASKDNGCVVWYDGSDTSTMTLTSNYLTKWNDVSGNNHHLYESSTPNNSWRFLYRSNQKNSLGAVYTQGQDNGTYPYMETLKDINELTGHKAVTVYWVIKDESTILGIPYELHTGITMNGDGINGGNGIAYYTRDGSNDDLNLNTRGPEQNSGYTQVMIARQQFTSYSLMTVTYEAVVGASTATQCIVCRKNKVQLSTTNSVLNGSTLQNQRPFRFPLKLTVGSRKTFQPWRGNFAEFIIYAGKHSAFEMDKVETYLMNKWAL